MGYGNVSQINSEARANHSAGFQRSMSQAGSIAKSNSKFKQQERMRQERKAKKEAIAKRVEEMAADTSAKEREQSKTEYVAAVKAAGIEQTEEASHIKSGNLVKGDTEGSLQWSSKYQKEEATKAFLTLYGKGNTGKVSAAQYEKQKATYIENYNKENSKEYKRTYKSKDTINREYGNINTSIENAHRISIQEGNRNPLADRMHNLIGTGINAVTGESTVDMRKPEASPAFSTSIDAMLPVEAGVEQQAPKLTPMPTDTQGTTKDTTFTQPVYDAKGKVITGDFVKRETTRADGSSTQQVGTMVDGSFVASEGISFNKEDTKGDGSKVAIKVLADKFVDGNPVNAVMQTTTDAQGNTREVEGIMVNGVFEAKPLSSEGSAPLYDAGAMAAVDSKRELIESATSSVSAINKIVAMYDPSILGTTSVLNTIQESSDNFFTFMDTNTVGTEEKRKVLATISKQGGIANLSNKYPQYAERIKNAVLAGDVEGISVISDEINSTEDAVDKQWLINSVGVSNEDYEQMTKEYTINAEIEPVLRSLIRSWRNGDKKIAFGEVKESRKLMSQSANAEEFMSTLTSFKQSMNKKTTDALGSLWSSSKYGPSKNSSFATSNRISLDGGSTTERGNVVYGDKLTGGILRVMTGYKIVRGKKRAVRYFMDSQSNRMVEYYLEPNENSEHEMATSEVESQRLHDMLKESYKTRLTVTGADTAGML